MVALMQALREPSNGHRRLALAVELVEPRPKNVESALQIGDIHRPAAITDRALAISAAATSGACTSRVSIVGAANIDTRECRAITSRIASTSKCGNTIWCAPFRRNGNAYSPAPCDTGAASTWVSRSSSL